MVAQQDEPVHGGGEGRVRGAEGGRGSDSPLMRALDGLAGPIPGRSVLDAVSAGVQGPPLPQADPEAQVEARGQGERDADGQPERVRPGAVQRLELVADAGPGGAQRRDVLFRGREGGQDLLLRALPVREGAGADDVRDHGRDRGCCAHGVTLSLI